MGKLTGTPCQCRHYFVARFHVLRCMCLTGMGDDSEAHWHLKRGVLKCIWSCLMEGDGCHHQNGHHLLCCVHHQVRHDPPKFHCAGSRDNGRSACALHKARDTACKSLRCFGRTTTEAAPCCASNAALVPCIMVIRIWLVWGQAWRSYLGASLL